MDASVFRTLALGVVLDAESRFPLPELAARVNGPS